MEALRESVAQLSQVFDQKLAQFNDRQQNLNTANPANPDVLKLDSDFTSFKGFVLNSLHLLQRQVELLSQQTDNLEMHTRRKILLLHGVPEEQNENTAVLIAKIMVEKLKLNNFKSTDISRCHRMGKSTTSGKPRPILYKVRDVGLRAKVWSAKTSFKGSGITISEFLTKARHDAFMVARQRFGVTKCWTRDGYIYILNEAGERHRITTLKELDKLCVQSAPAATARNATGVVREPGAARPRPTGTVRK